MNPKQAGLVALVLLGPIGCAAGPGVVRGQNPGADQGWVQSAPAANAISYDSCPSCQMQQQAAAPAKIPDYTPYAAMPYRHVLNHDYGVASSKDRRHHPTHYHWMSYRAPTNLVYPPAFAPAPVVQYPYYTLKGPSDYFLP